MLGVFPLPLWSVVVLVFESGDATAWSPEWPSLEPAGLGGFTKIELGGESMSFGEVVLGILSEFQSTTQYPSVASTTARTKGVFISEFF